MRRKILFSGAVAMAMAASVILFVKPAQAAVGLRVNGGRIVEANGGNFIMRGVSHPHVWYPSQTSSFANIKRLGANTVRVVLSSGHRGSPPSTDIPNIVNLCRTNRLICVLEDHDTTGYGEVSGAATLDQAASYWISQRSALVGTENFIIINIGNEPFGNNTGVSSTWPTATSNAIGRLRGAGFEHMLMVDAPMWGQDWQFIMRDNAQAVFNSDPQRNTVFSIHMYGVFNTAAEITEYLGRFRSAGLPIVVGEFGHYHSDGDPDEETIFSYTRANEIGYIGWSWSGNGGGVEYLDMATNFNPNQLTWWGQRIFNGTNGIRQTSREATWFSGGTPSPTGSPPSPATFNLVGSGSGKCVDVPGASQTNGTGLIIYTCHTGSNQRWTQTATNELRIYNNSKCMEAGTSAGNRAVINSCTGGNNQKWTFNANGTVTNVQSGLCLDVNGGSTANEAALIVWTCHGGSNQIWTRRA